MNKFEYIAPQTLEEALALLAKYGDESKVIAGGQSLLVLMRQGLVNPDYLIDVKGLSGLQYIKLSKASGLKIGALTTHRAIETSPVLNNGFSILPRMEKRLSSVQTRNWGTIGGNLCQADPAGDPAVVFLALNAAVKLASAHGERILPLENFLKDYYETDLKSDELLVEIQVPSLPAGTKAAFNKFTLVEDDYALVSVGVSITTNPRSGKVKEARIALGSVAPAAFRAKRAERVLVENGLQSDSIAEAARIAAEEARPIADIHSSEQYKREMVKVLLKRTISEVLETNRNVEVAG